MTVSRIEADKAAVSVVVPAYNAERTIADCLASIVAQTLSPAEIVIIDDGSKDATWQEIQLFTAAYPAFRFITFSQPNAGAGSARNRALNLATQPVVAFLDADDSWLPEKLRSSMAALSDGIDMVSTDMVAVNEDGVESAVLCSRYMPNEGNPFESLFLRGFIATSTVLVRRNLLLAAGGFDESLAAAQDYDLWLRLSADPKFVLRILPQPLTRYAIRKGSITSQAQTRLLCGIRILFKCYPVLRLRSRSPSLFAIKKGAILIAEYFSNFLR